jgi:phage shock protein E
MGFFNMFSGPSMDEQLASANQQPDALIVDVRTPGEFAGGHVPHAINVPVSSIEDLEKKTTGKDQPLYLYCASGARSSSAAKYLKSRGYTQVVNMGGIGSYSGPLER